MVLLEWFRAHQVVTGWLFGLSVAMFLGSLVLLPILVSRIRPDYFLSRQPPPESWGDRHAASRFVVLAIKNALGLVLLVAGIAMLVLPGQGVLTILVGISLLDFPGKRRLELRIVRQRRVLRAINWMRARAGRPPLILPETDRERGESAPV